MNEIVCNILKLNYILDYPCKLHYPLGPGGIKNVNRILAGHVRLNYILEIVCNILKLNYILDYPCKLHYPLGPGGIKNVNRFSRVRLMSIDYRMTCGQDSTTSSNKLLLGPYVPCYLPVSLH